MYNTNSQKVRQIKTAFLFVFTVLIVLIAVHLYSLTRFRVVSTDPALGQFSNAIPALKVSFNKQLDSEKGFSVTSKPNIVKSYQVSGKTITISLNALSLNTSYKIILHSVTSLDNQKISNKTFHFTTKYIDPADLPKDQQQAILQNQEHYSSPSNDPIVSHLPYSTLDFILTAEIVPSNANKSKLVLHAQILLPPGASGTQADSYTTQYEQEVVSYIQSLGLNPSNYDIEYQMVYESITGV